MRRFWLGVLSAYVLLVVLFFGGLLSGAVSAGADSKPGAIERAVALASLHTAIRLRSAGLSDPVKLTDASLLAGEQIYAAKCLVCHGAADGNSSAIARGLNVVPPQLARDGVEDDPEGETYWKVVHGIRLTGMPAFDGALSDEQAWQVTQFVSHLSHLPPAVEAAWKGRPSAGTL